MKLSSETNDRSRLKAFKIERIIIENPFRFGIAGQKYLKAAIEQKSIDLIRPDTSTNSVGRIKQHKILPGLIQPQRTAQAGKPTADNYHS